MRKDARELKVLALRELPRKTFHVARSNAQPVHSRIDLQVERHGLFAAAARRCLVE